LKKILLISDTHGHLDGAILKYVKQADEVWHAGDIGIADITDELTKLKPLRAVYGNIDGHELRSIFKEDLRFNCEGVEVLMTHIGGYPERYNSRVRKLLQTERPKLFICGHSHILKVKSDKKLGLLHLNPGAAGVYGFHKIRTMLRFTLDKGKIENLEIVELGARGKI
jgi:putative phosphoesterase|tara:strand:+ start:112 stop:615 length:504 start_codon:yes stop_codon:yes gene_type:complete